MDFLVAPRQRIIYIILFAVMGTSLITNYGNFGSLFSLEGDEIYTKVLNKTCKNFSFLEPENKANH